MGKRVNHKLWDVEGDWRENGHRFVPHAWVALCGFKGTPEAWYWVDDDDVTCPDCQKYLIVTRRPI